MDKDNQTKQTSFPLTYGMVGGGQDAFIGDVHRKAIALDGQAKLAAGVFSRSFDNTLETGKQLGLAKDRLYQSFEEMAKAEAARPDGIDFVVIVTPNNTHFPIARVFLEQGIHVVCDKPLTTGLEEAEELERLVHSKDLMFCVTYTYTGYPMVKHLREIINQGDLGQIRMVNAEYAQEWLATPLERNGQKQSVWRTDPDQSGVSGCVGDIGSHIENIVAYVTNLRIKSLTARLDTFVEDRKLDDNATIMVDYDTGAKGMYWCSQVAIGHNNGLSIRIYGSKGSARWHQERPDELELSFLDQPTRILYRGRDELAAPAQVYNRIPAGHPEGFFEAFANIYKTFISALEKKNAGIQVPGEEIDFPGISAGVQGIRFIERCVESSQKGSIRLEI